MTARHAIDLRYRLDVAARLIAASAGGYGVAVLVAIAGAWALPGGRIETALTGNIAALLALPVAAIGCFWARRAARAWIGLALFAMLFAGIALAGGWRP